MMFAIVLNSNHYFHFSSWNKELWISISQTIRCEWKLCLNHVHFILGNIRRCFYHFMLSNSLSLFCWVSEDDSLSLFQSQQYLWHICLFQLKGLPLTSNVLLRILQSNEWKWWRVLLGWERPSITVVECWLKGYVPIPILLPSLLIPYPVINLRPLLLNTTIIIYMFQWFWNSLSSMTVLSELIKYLYLIL